jgi:hypothetical protein
VLVGAGAGAVAAGLFGVLAWNAQGRYEATSFERTAAEERARFDRYRTFALISVAGAGVAGLSAGALLLWPRARSTGPGLDGVAFTGSGLHALGRF